MGSPLIWLKIATVVHSFQLNLWVSQNTGNYLQQHVSLMNYSPQSQLISDCIWYAAQMGVKVVNVTKVVSVPEIYVLCHTLNFDRKSHFQENVYNCLHRNKGLYWYNKTTINIL